jgi:DNA-binding protein YbaB
VVEPTNMAGVADDFERLAGQMRHTANAMAATLAQAASASYQVSSSGDEVTVDTDGRPRITDLRIAPRAMRLDSVALGELITQTLNAGLRTARQASQAAVVDGLDPAMRATFTAGMSEADRAATAEPDSGDRQPGRGAR